MMFRLSPSNGQAKGGRIGGSLKIIWPTKVFPSTDAVAKEDRPKFDPWPGRGSNFGRPSFATASVDGNVKLLI